MRMIKYLIILFICFITITMISCDNENDVPNVLNYSESDYKEFPDKVIGLIKDKKIYITSIGQSNDMNNFELIISQKMSYLQYTSDSFLSPNDVEKNAVVLVFVGCSIKGLGESGTSLAEETKRAEAFSEKAKNNNFIMVAFHLGGPSRRGSTSDKLIDTIFSSSKLNIFVGSGNSDKFLTDISFKNTIPCYEIGSFSSLEGPMKLLLNIKE